MHNFDDEMKSADRIAVIGEDHSVPERVHRWLVVDGHSVETHPTMPGSGVDLVIADVASPRDAGRLIADLISACNGAATLLVSARFRTGQHCSPQVAKELGVASVLPKPFTKRELIEAEALSLGTSAAHSQSTSTFALKE